MKRVLFHPPFPSEAALGDHALQAAWYLRPVIDRVGEILLPCSFPVDSATLPGILDRASAAPPDHLDPALCDVLPPWRGRLRAVPAGCPPGPSGGGEPPVDMVVVWSGDGAAGRAAARRLEARCILLSRALELDRTTGELVETDLANATDWMAAAWQLIDDRVRLVRRSEALLAALAARLGTGRDVFLYGTGPSLERADPAHARNAVAVVCNGIVFRPDILAALAPRFLAIYDDHLLDCRRWTGRFRAALASAMAAPGLTLVVPAAYLPNVFAMLPEDRHDRVLGIPLTGEGREGTDLVRRFWLNPTNNVLSTLMLPLARVFAAGGGTVNLLGFDGRPFDAEATDWPHAAGTRNRERDAAEARAGRHVMPYGHRDVLLHYLWLDRAIAELESRSIRVRTLAPSYAPPLAARFSDAARPA